MALEDALVLAHCPTPESIPAALAAFEAHRRPRTNWVRAQTHRRDRVRNLLTQSAKLLRAPSKNLPSELPTTTPSGNASDRPLLLAAAALHALGVIAATCAMRIVR